MTFFSHGKMGKLITIASVTKSLDAIHDGFDLRDTISMPAIGSAIRASSLIDLLRKLNRER